MAQRELTVVVGAGTGADYRMPAGERLKASIAELFAPTEDRWGDQIWGTPALRETLISPLVNSRPGLDSDQIIAAMISIRSGVVLAPSIDEFIDAHGDKPAVALCGKVAVAQCIAQAERNSALWFSRDRLESTIDFASLQKAWLIRFFWMLVRRCQVASLPERFARISIINFNYDRCVEHFLYHAIMAHYGVSEGKAATLIQSLEIMHPYGTIGPLPWQGGDGALEFGQLPSGTRTIRAADRIRTFTQSVDAEASDVVAIRKAFADSPRLLFLGFAFHQMNLELLRSDTNGTRRRRIWASAFGVSGSNREIIKARVEAAAGAREGSCQLNGPEGTSRDTLDEYALAMEF